MKKVYLSLCTILFVGLANAQSNKGIATKRALTKNNETSVKVVKGKGSNEIQDKVTIVEDDFSNPANWTIGNNSGNGDNWIIGTSGPAGGFAIPVIASTSAANGFALYDSDLMCSGDQTGYLQYATPIDCSGFPGVLVEFEQNFRSFQDQTIVEVSTDGANWTQFEVNAGIDDNSSTANPELTTVNISAVAGGQATVYVRFLFYSSNTVHGPLGGCGYSWMVDDFKLVEAQGNDLQLTEAFTHDIINSYDYSIEAGSQMQPMVVGAVLANMGGTAAVGASLSVTINDGTSDVYTTPATFDLEIGVTDTLWITTGLMPESNKTYTISFVLPADDNTANDIISTSFATSDATYAQDHTVDQIYRFNQDDETAMGNIFQIFNATTLNAAAVKFETGTTAVSAIIRVSRFDFDDANFNSIQAMEYVDEVEYTIPASAIGSGEFSNINFNAPIALEAGWNYVVEVRKNAGTDRIFIGGSEKGDADFSTACYGPFGADDAVNYYSGWGFSPAVRMSFVSAPTVTSSDTDNALCSNETLTLTSSAAAGNTWTLDGTVIPNEVGTTLTVSAAGTYAAVVNGIASAPVVVSATNIDPTITNVFGTFAATQGGGATYVWVDCNNGNSPVVPAATGQTYAPSVAGNYGVIISLNGCTSTSECVLNINENEAVSSFNVYPNPAAENVEVSYALKNNSTVNVTITDLSGKVVYASNLGNKAAGAHALNVNTTTFSNGIYVVNFATDNAVITEKLVIRK